YNRRSPINLWPEWTGAMHGDDLNDIFGIPFRHPEKYDRQILQDEKDYSEMVMWAIGNFTKEGKTTDGWNKIDTTNHKAFVLYGKLGEGEEKKYTDVTPPTCTEFYKLYEESVKRRKSLNSITTTPPNLPE
ncbi:Carboxylesterase, type B domain-containing protein, partial [Strongyloides ratti]